MSKSVKFTAIFSYMAICFLLISISMINPMFTVITLGLLVAGFLFILFFTGKLNLYHYVSILIPSIVLSPFIQTPPGLPMVKLEDIWLLFGLVLLVTKIIFTKDLKFTVPSHAKIF